jgi:hypothetical protein
MSHPLAPFGPLTHRVPAVLTWLRRETAKDRPATVAFAHLCTALSVPPDLQPPLLRLLVDEGHVIAAGGHVQLSQVGAKPVSPAPRHGATAMTFGQRQARPTTTYPVTVLIRLDRERWVGGDATGSFPLLCDVTSIPRDLRASLLGHLLAEGYVTREGDQIRITEAGTRLVVAALTPPVPDGPPRNPAPADRQSRVRP